MASFPAEILLGIYLGLLVGIIPALIAWAIGFGSKYSTGVSVPVSGVVVGAVILAGANGWLLSLVDETIVRNPSAPRVATAVVVVTMLSVYADSRGKEMATAVPSRLTLSTLRDQTLTRDLADLVGGGDEVAIRIVGEVADMEGYPPLPEDLRAEIRNTELTLPADLRLGELEERAEDRLRTEYDLGEVSATVDDRGRATVVAAPPFSGLSKRVSSDRHAVSVTGLVPTGLARGDEVTVLTPDAQVRGTVLSAETDTTSEERPDTPDPFVPEESVSDLARPVRAPTTDGGEGRVTVAVTRTDVQPLLRAGEVKIVVESRGTRREHEVVSLLRQADRRFRRLSIRSGGPLAGTRLGRANLRDTDDVAVLAVQKRDGWTVGPDGQTVLEAGDELFAVGTRDALEAFPGGTGR